MKIRAFITHKLAEKYADCQDYFLVDKSNRVVCVSDGVSQSVFSNYWSKILCESFRENPDWDFSDNEVLKQAKNSWLKKVNEFLENKKTKGENPWRLENSLSEQKGASATLLAIKFDKDFNYSGYVLGDSSLIKVSCQNEIEDIISTSENGFNNHPDYFDSFFNPQGEPKKINDKINQGAKLLLLSDPFAEFFYQNKDNATEFLNLLDNIDNHKDFCDLVENWRKNYGLHNDDSTLVIIENDSSDSSFNSIYLDNLEDLINYENISKEELYLENKELREKNEESRAENKHLVRENRYLKQVMNKSNTNNDINSSSLDDK